jgi:tetratricopeptide (TPR) repeat protein
MKIARIRFIAAALSIATLLPAAGLAQSASGESRNASPAELRIAAARLQIQANPKKAQAFNDLALALIRRARETEDPVYFSEPADAISTGFTLVPGDFQLAKARIALQLGRQEFAAALVDAASLNKRVPDDATIYGYIAEADIALGNYDDAVSSTQWMLNILPYNVPGLIAAAELRDLHGDPEGALELLDRSYAETSPTETEELAWIANRMAAISTRSGHPDVALRTLDEAEQIYPHYRYTLENRACANMALGKPQDAIAALAQLPKTPHVLYETANAEAAAGHSKESEAAYADFEKAARPLIAADANDNVDLILYYADKGATSASAAQESLNLAQKESSVRSSVWSLDSYAWALYANRKYADADTQIQKALAIGIRNDQIFDHAGHIAKKLNKYAAAAGYFQSALQLHSSPRFAEDAREQLASLPSSLSTPPLTSASAAQYPSPAEASPAATSVPLNNNVLAEDHVQVPSGLMIPRATATDRMIRTLQQRVSLNPKLAANYSALGAAFLQRARETGDVEDYQLAEQSLNRSLDLVSNDLSSTASLLSMAELCMGEHRFQDALTYAQKALALGSGDLSPFAIVGDAYADMGEYEKAAAAYSRLLPDPASPARTLYVRDSRLAFLKFVAGDTDAAIHLMQGAVNAGIEAQIPGENLAWLYFELGEFYFQSGDVNAAGRAYTTALTKHPGDYRALAGLGRTKASQGEFQEAIVLYQHAIAVVPMPVYVAELGDIYLKTGNTQEAEKQYRLVEYIGLLGHINQVLHNRDLALFYADHDRNLNESLTLARKEFEVRSDVYTWDALAWSLYKNGSYQEAGEAMNHAARLGTKDSMMLFHAGMIGAKLGNTKQAQDNLTLALKINPHFHVLYAAQAKQQLISFEKQPAQTASGMDSHVQASVR